MAPRHGLPLFIPRSFQPFFSSSVSPFWLLNVDHTSLFCSASLFLCPFCLFCLCLSFFLCPNHLFSFLLPLDSKSGFRPSVLPPFSASFLSHWFSSFLSSCSSLPRLSLILITFSSSAYPFVLCFCQVWWLNPEANRTQLEDLNSFIENRDSRTLVLSAPAGWGRGLPCWHDLQV